MKLIARFVFAALLAAPATALALQIDSVTVDSVWNSDSAWKDWRNVSYSRTSRDCRISFTVAGSGSAACSVYVSFDAAATWRADSIAVLAPASMLVPCKQKTTVVARILGGDRQNVAIRVIGRQTQIAIEGNPTMVGFDPFGAFAADSTVTATLAVKVVNADNGLGAAPVAKVWWDSAGNGTWDDSTTGLSRTFTMKTPAKGAMRRDTIVVKARDANGFWSVPETLFVQFGLGLPLTLANISAGTFAMGNAEFGPIHNVTLSAFGMMNSLVTQEQYLAVTGANPSYFTGDLIRPVESVTWFDAVLFCNRLSKAAGKDTCYSYSSQTYTGNACTDLPGITCDFSKKSFRLPTEAEYEYACRAGTTTNYFWGDSIDTNYCWYGANSGGTTHDVKTKPANSWGLYDMSGNLWEWTGDWYADYVAGAVTNPTGPATGQIKVQRGGSYSQTMTGYYMSGFRNPTTTPDISARVNGFRVVLPQ